MRLENFTRPLGERGAAIVANLENGLGNANLLLEQLVDFSSSLNDNEGTLSRLMNDPELYDRLNNSLANIEDITRRARPIVDDLRVFSDKIARDPRMLGVKGALDGRPLGTGTKYSNSKIFGNEQPVDFYEEVAEPEEYLPPQAMRPVRAYPVSRAR